MPLPLGSRTLDSRGLVLYARALSQRMSTHAPSLPVFVMMAAAVVTTASCRWGSSTEPAGTSAISSTSASAPVPLPDPREECTRSIEEVLRRPALPGAPAFDLVRAQVLGRARGEPMVFVREPERVRPDALPEPLRASRKLLDTGAAGVRITQVSKRHARQPEALRTLLLREGYAYAPDPHDALALIANVRLPDLFAEPEIWMMRRAQAHRLVRAPMRVCEVLARDVSGGNGGVPLRGRSSSGTLRSSCCSVIVSPLHRTPWPARCTGIFAPWLSSKGSSGPASCIGRRPR